MPILRSINEPQAIYEHKNGFLVALERSEEKKLKTSQKANRRKPEANKDQVKGHKFILDEEFDSLKIDFSKLLTFKVTDLTRFDGK